MDPAAQEQGQRLQHERRRDPGGAALGAVGASAARARVGLEVRVALYLPRSTGFLTALLAVWKAGGVYVPVDASYPEAYAQRILEDAQPAVVVVQSGLDRALLPAGAQVHGDVSRDARE
ncbi:MAG TPA: AMP-binding protein [Chthoniobacterales bacterium]|nr:AMP-binding protein [Chthoniobacterales bacterium]